MDWTCTPNEHGRHTQGDNEMDPTRKMFKRKAKINVQENSKKGKKRKWLELGREKILGAGREPVNQRLITTNFYCKLVDSV